MSEQTRSARSGRWSRLVGQFVRFAVVGGSGVVVNMAVAVVLNKLHGGSANATRILFPIPGTSFNFRFSSLVWIVSFLIANLYNYQLNRSWTFRGTSRGWWKGFWQFLSIGAVAALIGLVLKALMVSPGNLITLRGDWFDAWTWRHGGSILAQLEDACHSPEYVAHALSVLVTMPINFIVNKLWTFRGRKPAAPVGPRDGSEASQEYV
ncbi:GtrA family protein [Propionibacterium australiense]|uniref:GtrA family protein n=1 Tax=Propionibacterium australiense TaxID=119981 RepID=A0A383S7U7_9ACTN|nr:GtrA family protein [Propionibacterium australiense]RLP06790.1 GtrA family protein [Propionibacterium australiense]RLP06956.1 GtrA family protein [Propionibacterium australiense]SYZ34048.1 GtrA-like protein [Propionibacterium australiense]VEH92102.1 GtrA-like protein [Propionibacterium australiense]